MIPLPIRTEFNEDETNSLLVSLDGTWHRKKYESEDDIVSKYHDVDDSIYFKLSDKTIEILEKDTGKTIKYVNYSHLKEGACERS